MEFFNIQNLLDNQINYNQFDYKKMSEEEKEILFFHLKSKITIKNQYYDKIIENDINDKNIMSYITYLIEYNNYNPIDIKKLINKVKITFEMSKIEEEEKEDPENILLKVENKINSYLNKILNLQEIKEEEKEEKNSYVNGIFKINQEIKEEEKIIYIQKINEENFNILLEIFKESFKINYDLKDFFYNYTRPMFDEKYVCNENIINDIISNIIKTDLNKDLRDYILNQITNFINHEFE